MCSKHFGGDLAQYLMRVRQQIMDLARAPRHKTRSSRRRRLKSQMLAATLLFATGLACAQGRSISSPQRCGWRMPPLCQAARAGTVMTPASGNELRVHPVDQHGSFWRSEFGELLCGLAGGDLNWRRGRPRTGPDEAGALAGAPEGDAETALRDTVRAAAECAATWHRSRRADLAGPSGTRRRLPSQNQQAQQVPTADATAGDRRARNLPSVRSCRGYRTSGCGNGGERRSYC